MSFVRGFDVVMLWKKLSRENRIRAVDPDHLGC